MQAVMLSEVFTQNKVELVDFLKKLKADDH